MLRRITPLFTARRGQLTLNQALREKDVMIVDVRTQQEVAESGTCPGAVNIPLDAIPINAKIFGGDRTRPIVFFCAKGIRAANAADFLTRLGFSNSYSTTNAQSVMQLLNEAKSSKSD